ncbi:hypothetical protein Tco_1013034, partial [Tanacetum coccineum]
YVVPTGKDNFIVSAGRPNMVPAGKTIVSPGSIILGLESSDTDEAAQYGGNPMSVTFEIHHGRCFTPTPNKSYVGGQSELNVLLLFETEIRLGLWSAPFECDANVLEMPNSKALSIGEVMKTLSKKHPASSVEGTIIKETVDPFDGLDEILGDYANTREEITGKQMIVHTSNSSTVKNVVDNDMLFKTEVVDPIGNFKGVEVDIDSKTEEESDIEENDTSDSDSEDLDYDPKHNEVFDDDEKYT